MQKIFSKLSEVLHDPTRLSTAVKVDDNEQHTRLQSDRREEETPFNPTHLTRVRLQSARQHTTSDSHSQLRLGLVIIRDICTGSRSLLSDSVYYSGLHLTEGTAQSDQTADAADDNEDTPRTTGRYLTREE